MLSLAASTSDDYFEFEVRLKTRITGEQPSNAASFHISARLDARRFEDINVDMEIGETIAFETEVLKGQEFLTFAGLESDDISIISLEQHLAEKIHAYARHFSDDRENTRVKDLVDIVLISGLSQIAGSSLINAIAATFRNRSETPPSRLAPPPDDWKLSFARMAKQVNLDPRLETNYAMACRFLDPVLARETHDAYWNPDSHTWIRD